MADQIKESGMVPDWLLKNDEFPFNTGGKNRLHFLRKTLKGITKVIQDELFCERYGSFSGLLQQVDPRIKLIVFLFFILYTALTNSIFSLVLLEFMTVLLTVLSKIPLRILLKRVWLVMPLFVLAVSLPAAFNIFVDGKPVWVFVPERLYLTENGVRAVLKTFLRTGVSLSFAFLLIMTTGWAHITKAFTALKVPGLVVTILNMTYRYLFVLTALAKDMTEARLLRTVGRVRNKENRFFVSRSIAYLFIKSGNLAQEIYHAMRLRGYFGKSVSLKQIRMSASDLLFSANMFILFLMIFFFSKIV